MIKHSKLLTALFLVQGLVLTGCGGSGGGTTVSGEDPDKVEPAEWNLVWSDEFEGDAIDTAKWGHEVNCDGGGNNELQCYTDSAENSFVADGMLHIVARNTGGTGDDAYSSARLRTLDKGDWKYGRIEVNAKMPEGQGLWPAIWMLPSESVYGVWPLSGEIDIAESVNPNGTGGNEVYGTLHYGRAWPNNLNSGDTTEPDTNIWEEFHTYAIEWEQGEIRWYIDGVHFATQTSAGWYTYYYDESEPGFLIGEGDAPFNQKFHLLLNVAVGGGFPVGQAGNDEVTLNFPQEMVVDFVRVYECSADPETGLGCATNVDRRIDPLEGNPGTQNVYTLYEDGPSTLTFEVPGDTVENTVVPQYWEEAIGNIAFNSEYSMDGDTVWDIQFYGLSNASLVSGDMSAEETVNDGFVFKTMAETGEIKFDIYIESIDPETQLLVKIDSGEGAVSSHSLEIPPVGEWTTVSVRLSEILGSAVHGNIVSPFVLEATGGTAHVRLDDIRVSCLSPCGLTPRLAGVFFEFTDSFDIWANGELDPNWADDGIDVYNGAGQNITTAEVVDGDQTVLEVDFLPGPGVMYIQTNILRDMTAFDGNGYLTFDIKPLTGDGKFAVKVDCINPCSSGNIVLDDTLIDGTSLPLDVWTTVEVPISRFKNGGTNLSRVDTPFIILPMDAQPAKFQLNNIRWVYEEGVGSGGPTYEAIESNFFIFEDTVNNALWDGLALGYYLGEGYKPTTIDASIVPEAGHGDVLQLEFGSGFGTMYVQSETTKKDLSAFASGNLKFDIKVVTAGANTGDFKVKGDAGGLEVEFTVDTVGTWESKTIPVASLGIPDLSAVMAPASIFPFDGQQDGTVIQIDNIRWELPAP